MAGRYCQADSPTAISAARIYWVRRDADAPRTRHMTCCAADWPAAFAIMELAEPMQSLRQDRLKRRNESVYFHS